MFSLLVLGAGGNTFAEIRRFRQSQPLKTLRLLGLLSPVDPLPLTIQILNSGLISVNVTGQNTSIIAANDTKLLPVKYLSFSTWGNTEAKWFYDCTNDRNDDKLIEIKQNFTPFERLQLDLFSNYDENTAPVDLKAIKLDFNLVTADFVPRNAILKSRGRISMVKNSF